MDKARHPGLPAGVGIPGFRPHRGQSRGFAEGAEPQGPRVLAHHGTLSPEGGPGTVRGVGSGRSRRKLGKALDVDKS